MQKQLSTLQDSIKIVEEQQSATQGEVACLGKRLSSLEDQEPFKRIRLKIQDERLHHQDGRLDKIEKEAGVLVTQVQGLEKEVIGEKIKMVHSLIEGFKLISRNVLQKYSIEYTGEGSSHG